MTEPPPLSAHEVPKAEYSLYDTPANHIRQGVMTPTPKPFLSLVWRDIKHWNDPEWKKTKEKMRPLNAFLKGFVAESKAE